MSASLLTAGFACCAAAAGAQSIDGLPESRFVEHRERFTPEGGAPIERFLITAEAAADTARVVDASRAALTMMARWFGPLSPASLTVAGVPWRPGHRPDHHPGLVAARLRWLTMARDQATEREVIDGVVRQYWTGSAPGAGGFGRAVAGYIATRAIHHQLEGSNFATPRFLGGIVPFPLRALLLSPPVADPRPRAWPFDESDVATEAEVLRGVKALQTLERYVGWPAMLEALSAMRATTSSSGDAGALAEALSEVRGTDMRFLVAECFRSDAVFDYALAELRSVPGSANLTETTVTIIRNGSGRFATDAGQRNPSVPLRVRFADGSEFRDVFDGAAPSVSLVYSAESAAISATIDPDAMLLVDVNRENNAITRDTRVMPLGARLALHWMAWLQNAMLSYTSLI